MTDDKLQGRGEVKDQTILARQQAVGLDNWADVLEVHKPESSAAGIVMLRAAAKTLRELAADAPPEPTEEMVEAGRKAMNKWIVATSPIPPLFMRSILEAAFAAAPKEE